MVGWVGNAPTMVRQDFCFTGSSRSLRDYQPVGTEGKCGWEASAEKMVAGAGVEPAHGRFMRPLPYHLATPQFERWHGVSVLPRGRSVLEAKLRTLAPAVNKMVKKDAAHRCSRWTASGRRGYECPRRLRQKRTNTAANLRSHPQENFTAVLSVFQAHLPGACCG
jgi:hypothetical protein